MDDILKIFLTKKDTNAAQLCETLSQQQEEIIKSFGGITSVVELCLSHPEASNHIDTNSQHFHRFRQIISCSYIDSSSDNINVIVSKNSATQIPNINTINQISSSSQLGIITNIPRLQQQTMSSLTEYREHMMIIDSDPRSNTLFKWINNTDSALFMHNGVLDIRLLAFIVGVTCIDHGLWFVHVYVSSISTLFTICRIIFSTIIMIYAVLLMLSTNTMVIELIISGFDFWFKVYSAAMLLSSTWIRHWYIDDYRRSDLWPFVADMCYHISILSCAGVFFVFDAVPFSINIKRIAILAFIFFAIYNAIFVYFFAKDLEWNPFEFEYSQISFKSITLSAYINIIIFVGKPIFHDIIACIKRASARSIDNNDRSSGQERRASIAEMKHTTEKEKGYHRCGAIYKRPYLKWVEHVQSRSVGDSNNENTMSMIIG